MDEQVHFSYKSFLHKIVGRWKEDLVITPPSKTPPQKANPPNKHTGEKIRRPGIRERLKLDSEVEIDVHPKSDHEKQAIQKAISSNEFLESILQGKILDVIIDAMYSKEIEAGDVIIQEGEPGNHMYVSNEGKFDVYIKNRLVNSFSDQKVFGELAVLYNNKRLATIKARTNGKVWVLPRVIYQQSLVRDAVQYMNETLSFLKNVPLINKLNEDKLRTIANLLQKEFYKTDTQIVREGDEGDKFYLIRAGSVSVTKKEQGKVGELGKGAFFGELALVYSDKRQATVTAEAPGVECLTLTRTQFHQHIDKGLLKIKGNTFEEAKPASNPPTASTSTTEEYSDVKLPDLKIVKIIGTGGFGRVALVQHRTKRDLTFALKYLRKHDMVQLEQVEHVYNEKKIQISCNSPFIVRLYNTFKDNKYLYFLMESCLGGDLWTYLQKQKNKSVPEADAKFYAGCVLEALDYLHSRNFIYRDLKPENLLIDSQGYLKLTDFGFAKSLENQMKTFTFAGTPEYVAPEIIYNRGHDKCTDYWAFGVLIYELLAGKSPFVGGTDHMKTYNRILKGINSVPFPSHISKSAASIIMKLCRLMPTERLGAQKHGLDDIRNHRWFQGFDWNKLRSKKMKAPYVPKLRNCLDTDHFESFETDKSEPPDELSVFERF